MSSNHTHPTVGASTFGSRRTLADKDLTALITMGFRQGASDILLAAGTPPRLRLNGAYVPTGPAALSPDDVRGLMAGLLSVEELQRFEQSHDLDLGLEVEGLGRMRVNVFRAKGSVALSLRLIPSRIPTITELNLPPAIIAMVEMTRGLVLVTGPAGSGKSTLLAALVHQLNTERQLHIVTLEDPIEFVHSSLKSVVSQREVGPDTASFERALRAVLRQAPDVILVGEMRDAETIRAVLTIAETGHLVFSTLHTVTATQTLSRIVDSMPAESRAQIRSQLALSLRGIISLVLLPSADRTHSVPAREILVMNTGIGAMIREGQDHMIINAIQSGAGQGMISMEASIMQLVERKQVDPAAAQLVLNSFRLATLGRQVPQPGGVPQLGGILSQNAGGPPPVVLPPPEPPRGWTTSVVVIVIGVIVALQYQGTVPVPSLPVEVVFLAAAAAVVLGILRYLGY
jgi:twitching motility protein PilT